MSDADLRELERRFRETSSVEDEAAWLRARLQVGELPQEKLELAVYCGHAAACEAGGLLARPIPDIRSALESYGSGQSDKPPPWLSGLQGLGGDEVLKRLVPPALSLSRCYQGEFVEAVHALEAWLLSPGDSEKRSIRHLAADGALTRKVAAVALRHGGREVLGVDLMTAVAQALFLCLFEPHELARGLEQGAAEVVPWVLGYGDPVRERVEARQREAAGE